MIELPESNNADSPTEQEAIQQYRELLLRADASPELANFTGGLKRALTVSKAEYRAQEHDTPTGANPVRTRKSSARRKK